MPLHSVTARTRRHGVCGIVDKRFSACEFNSRQRGNSAPVGAHLNAAQGAGLFPVRNWRENRRVCTEAEPVCVDGWHCARSLFLSPLLLRWDELGDLEVKKQAAPFVTWVKTVPLEA